MVQKFKPGGQEPVRHKLSPEAPPPPRRVSFGWAYWHQEDWFGLGGCDRRWFVALAQRLAEYSKLKVSDLTERPREAKRAHRFHEIDFAQKNCPLTRQEMLDMIPQAEREGCTFFQLTISTGLGRVHGYFDADQIFQIVLLDPLHNLQPSEYTEYKLRRTTVADDHYAGLLGRLRALPRNRCGQGCATVSLVDAVLASHHGSEDQMLVVPMKEEDIRLLEQMLADGRIGSTQELFDTNFLRASDAGPKDGSATPDDATATETGH